MSMPPRSHDDEYSSFGEDYSDGGGVRLPDDQSLDGQLVMFAGTTQSSTKQGKSKKPKSKSKSKKTAKTADSGTGTKKSKKTADTADPGTGTKKSKKTPGTKKKKPKKSEQTVQDQYATSDDGLDHNAYAGQDYNYGDGTFYNDNGQGYDSNDDCTREDPDANLGQPEPSRYTGPELTRIAKTVITHFGPISKPPDTVAVLRKIRKRNQNLFNTIKDAVDEARSGSDSDPCHVSSDDPDSDGNVSHRGDAHEVGTLQTITGGPSDGGHQTAFGGH